LFGLRQPRPPQEQNLRRIGTWIFEQVHGKAAGMNRCVPNRQMAECGSGWQGSRFSEIGNAAAAFRAVSMRVWTVKFFNTSMINTGGQNAAETVGKYERIFVMAFVLCDRIIGPALDGGGSRLKSAHRCGRR
jgi:hypothetical protein